MSRLAGVALREHLASAWHGKGIMTTKATRPVCGPKWSPDRPCRSRTSISSSVLSVQFSCSMGSAGVERGILPITGLIAARWPLARRLARCLQMAHDVVVDRDMNSAPTSLPPASQGALTHLLTLERPSGLAGRTCKTSYLATRTSHLALSSPSWCRPHAAAVTFSAIHPAGQLGTVSRPG